MSGKGRIDPIGNLYVATLFDPDTYGVGTSTGEGVNTRVSFTINPAFDQKSCDFSDALVVMMPGSLAGGSVVTFRLREDDGGGAVDIAGASHVMSVANGNASQVNVGRVNLQARENNITAQIDVATAAAQFSAALVMCNARDLPVFQIHGTAFNVLN